MKIGFIGLGKLGLPCALAMEDKGHTVLGYDVSNQVKNNILARYLPYQEAGAQELLSKSNIRLVEVADLVECDIVFVAVQTPHDPLYEGVTRLPESRVDFNYSYLKDAVSSIARAALDVKRSVIVAVISTVLPGTIEREIKPVCNGYVRLVYNPYFIAMTTVIHDLLNPEFVLLGVDDVGAAMVVEDFYKTITGASVYRTSVRNAELIKVGYNVYIGMKLCITNTIMEICHKTGCDCDEVMGALKLAKDRLISDKYLDCGMGDGGSCHNRDQIALSWLAKKLDLSHDIFEDITLAREGQTNWFADLIIKEHDRTGLRVVILGAAYKPECNIVIGSPSMLLYNILKERFRGRLDIWDPYINGCGLVVDESPAVYFIGTKHEVFRDRRLPVGSVVIDPWRYRAEQDGVELIAVGCNQS